MMRGFLPYSSSKEDANFDPTQMFFPKVASARISLTDDFGSPT